MLNLVLLSFYFLLSFQATTVNNKADLGTISDDETNLTLYLAYL